MSDSNDLQVGDIVELRSGGPAMTVEIVSEQQGIGCVWFLAESLGHGAPQRASFPANALKKAI